MRMMGKKQIGELEPFELVIALMISELATFPMQDIRIPILHAIIPIITLLFLQVATSFIELKSEKARKILTGAPSILIKNGKIDIAELRYQRFNINDLLEELRLKGYFNLSDIEYAILETSGELSILPKTGNSNITKDDLNLSLTQESLPIPLIMDGNVNFKNLKILEKDETWLNSILKKNNIDGAKDVFIGIIDSKNKFYYQLKEGKDINK
ncbi:DUF421 domain-containing protein [Clostridium tagluense]|uniref:DUF421 domain-containing protein n=1 Tax=Clostridium tagluense TaxID=360422 RepID=UPI001C0B1B8D|nr:DUF421 domain-containing protein [Clostridium tagluense]MBU3127007.1 DUF421 domain-containing protein [Clostridium tagluense]MCB2311009.1 DUF421 domain-containing protein [Clostridium tagluense]MCB2316867.1 DUF421 domain-containing protein [Clostridium tagluense]MCB2321751.1 DUF421 domain-containing protein [Clostridium tagluense]MCB2325665.1 DUF421 domain-containing protein [Clostridium tagluense]